VETGLWKHKSHPGSAGTQQYHLLGKTGSLEEQFRILPEFVRPFLEYRIPPHGATRTRIGNWPIRHTVHKVEESRVTRQRESMEDDYANPYADPYVRPPAPRLRSAPIPEVVSEDQTRVREITGTLLAKLREGRVDRCVQYYAREDLGISGNRENVPIREEAIVTCIQALSRGYADYSEENRILRAEVESLQTALARSEDRVHKAEERSDLLASAYSVVEKELPKRKRAREE
jgi:hypothetical protein